jgi:hypothetical protein
MDSSGYNKNYIIKEETIPSETKGSLTLPAFTQGVGRGGTSSENQEEIACGDEDRLPQVNLRLLHFG